MYFFSGELNDESSFVCVLRCKQTFFPRFISFQIKWPHNTFCILGASVVNFNIMRYSISVNFPFIDDFEFVGCHKNDFGFVFGYNYCGCAAELDSVLVARFGPNKQKYTWVWIVALLPLANVCSDFPRYVKQPN
jgi:hypothetical protein